MSRIGNRIITVPEEVTVENIDNVYFDCFDTLIRRKYSIKYCFYCLVLLDL